MSEEPKPSHPLQDRPTRRGFLRRTGTLAVAALNARIPTSVTTGIIGAEVGAIGTLVAGQVAQEAGIIKPKERIVIVSVEEERLKTAGLGDFIGVYSRIKQFNEKYRAYPQLISPDFFNICTGVVAGAFTADSPEVKRIRDGWGERKGEAKEAAEDRIASLSIDLTDAEDTVGEIKNFLTELATVFPSHIATMPDKLEILTESSPKCDFKCTGYATRDELSIPSPKMDKEKALTVGIHELDHNIDLQWDRVKPFVERADYIRYYEAYLDYTARMAETWFRTDDVKAFSLLMSTNQYNTPDKWSDRLDVLEQKYFPSLSLPEELREDKALRFLSIARAVGAKFLKLHNLGNYSKEDLEFLEDKEIQTLIKEILGEIQHIFVDPANIDSQKVNVGQLPSVYEMSELFKITLNQERLAVFSILRPNASLDDFRKALGLPDTQVDQKEAEDQLKKERSAREFKSSMLEANGARKLGTYEYAKGKTYELFEIPDNPYAPNRKTLYV